MIFKGKDITHKHVSNTMKLHFDGVDMWRWSDTYNKWMVSDMLAKSKIVEV